jgi:hypothetical protein
MKTDELIRALAADEVKRPSLDHLIVGALAIGAAAAVALFLWRIGLRPNLAVVAAHDFRLILKFLVTLALAVSAAGLLLRLARPGVSRGLWIPALLIGPVMLAIGISYELMVFPPSEWPTRLIGRYSSFCLRSIPLLSAPILIALMIALRQGAPTRLALTGAVAGLLSGATGAFIYAAHCPDDSPLFVLTWYGLSIAAISVIGALIGSRVLRW